MAKSKTVQAAVSKNAPGAPPDIELTWKQENFVREYCKSGNATDAYFVTHNCSRETANVEGCRLLAKPSVKAAIDRRRIKLLDAADYKQQEHVNILVACMKARRSEFCKVMKDPDNEENYVGLGDSEYAIEETEVTDNEFGKKKKLKLLSKLGTARELQNIFDFKVKVDSKNEGADDPTVLAAYNRILKTGQKKGG